jgi:hypothetical protein
VAVVVVLVAVIVEIADGAVPAQRGVGPHPPSAPALHLHLIRPRNSHSRRAAPFGPFAGRGHLLGPAYQSPG